jgi:predicted thioesterase
MNKTFSQTITVAEKDTAASFGSGLLPVYATPSMILLMENTAMQMIPVNENESSVGIHISADHLKATAVGKKVTCTAECIENDGKKYTFKLTVTDETGDVVGIGEHKRAVVDVERFMSRIK